MKLFTIRFVLIISLFLAIFSNSLFSQNSVGLSNPDSISYILNYRLPDWGYSNFSLSSSSANFRKSTTKQEETNRLDNTTSYVFQSNEGKRTFYDLSLGGTYLNYKQTERTLSDLTFSPFIYLDKTKQHNDSFLRNGDLDSSVESDQTSNVFFVGFQESYTGYYYTPNDFFAGFLIDASVGFNFSKQNFDVEGQDPLEQKNSQRTILVFPEFSIGFGRVLNVTPQIRALRLNERLGELGLESTNSSEVLEMAQQISKRGRYNRSYDRPDKYFWNDMNSLLDNRLSKAGTFESFYLEDVFNEALGSRFSGYEISLNAEYSYNNQLLRTETDGVQTFRNFDIQRSIQPSLNLSWFKNFTLEHQIGIRASQIGILPLEKDNNIDLISTTDVSLEWLWNVADKSILTTSVSNLYSRDYLKDTGDNDDIVLDNFFRIGTTYSHFFENKFTISANLSLLNLFAHTRRPGIDSTYNLWSFQTGINITYYFFRNIY